MCDLIVSVLDYCLSFYFRMGLIMIEWVSDCSSLSLILI